MSVEIDEVQERGTLMRKEVFERIFPGDQISKRERVDLTLKHQPVDRVAIHDQLSYNTSVISLYTEREYEDYDYSEADIGETVRKCLDISFPLFKPLGTEMIVNRDGFIFQNDNWTSWIAKRPFNTVDGACEWLKKKISAIEKEIGNFDETRIQKEHNKKFSENQALIGETVQFNWSFTGFCDVFNLMGLEMYVYFSEDYPNVLNEFMELSVKKELKRISTVADRTFSPLILIPEDFATKHGPIFSPEFLHRFHYPFVKKLVSAWHEYDISVIYHSDGNYLRAIPDLIECNVDGFYCLEPNCGMDIVELKNKWPEVLWAGGIDGVDLMERGNPFEVKNEVRRQINETGALKNGGIFIGTSSEINPPIKPANFAAMIEEVGNNFNSGFSSGK